MRKAWLSLLILPALILGFFSVTAFTGAQNAHATPFSPKNQPCVLQSKDAGITAIGPEDSISGYNSTNNDAPLHLGRTGTISNSLTATIGFDSKFISAQLGFNVTASTAVSYDYTITVPPGHKGRIDTYGDFQTYLLTNSCTGQQATAYNFTNSIEYNGYIN